MKLQGLPPYGNNTSTGHIGQCMYGWKVYRIRVGQAHAHGSAQLRMQFRWERIGDSVIGSGGVVRVGGSIVHFGVVGAAPRNGGMTKVNERHSS